MICTNCDHSWCWVCGFSRGPENSHYEFIHIFCSALIGIYHDTRHNNWARFGQYLLMFLVIVLGPGLAAIALICFYFYGLVVSTIELVKHIRNCTNHIVLQIFLIFFGFVALLVLSVILLAIAAVLGALALTFIYIWLIIQILSILVTWCLKSRKIKIKVSQNQEPLLA